MSYKPDESTLVAYLYNELKAEERAIVETYLESHPEMKKELDEIRREISNMTLDKQKP